MRLRHSCSSSDASSGHRCPYVARDRRRPKPPLFALRRAPVRIRPAPEEVPMAAGLAT